MNKGRALKSLPAEKRQGSYRKPNNYLLSQYAYRGGPIKLFGFSITIFLWSKP